jgi:hypothetical protein
MLDAQRSHITEDGVRQIVRKEIERAFKKDRAKKVTSLIASRPG